MMSQGPVGTMRTFTSKAMLSSMIAAWLRATKRLRKGLRRINAFSALAADLDVPLPPSVVVLGRAWVYGTGKVHFGEGTLLYPDLHLETQDTAIIMVGEGAVISRGVHLVAMAGIRIGDGTMIGEYTSIRDANHQRLAGTSIRDAGHTARPILIGKQVWIGRGAAILAGVTIGDGATIGANAVVTRDVAPGSVVGGVPAQLLQSRRPAKAPTPIR